MRPTHNGTFMLHPLTRCAILAASRQVTVAMQPRLHDCARVTHSRLPPTEANGYAGRTKSRTSGSRRMVAA